MIVVLYLALFKFSRAQSSKVCGGGLQQANFTSTLERRSPLKRKENSTARTAIQASAPEQPVS